MLLLAFTQSRTHRLENTSTSVPDFSETESSCRAINLPDLPVLACGTANPGMASWAKTLGAGIDYLARLTEKTRFDVFLTNFTGFTDFSAKLTRAVLYVSGFSVKTGEFSNIRDVSLGTMEAQPPTCDWPSPIIVPAQSSGPPLGYP